PASWRKTSPLTRLLGPQERSVPHPGPQPHEVPHLIAYFRAPMDHWVPGYLTTMQAALALDRDPKAIRTATDEGLFPGMIKAPRIWKTSSNLIPVAELKKVFGEFVREAVPVEQAAAQMYSRLTQFLIFTAVRASMGCQLRWRNINENQKLIEYLPAR